jgi:hypothetical protein
MIFEYASTNVRPNAVRAIHQLVECVANANADKTLAKFLPFCSKNIRVELENGASSMRTTSVSSPLPSDATLHWSIYIFLYNPLMFDHHLLDLAILRGIICKCVLQLKLCDASDPTFSQ